MITAILECIRGWRPSGDNAVITFHAWQSLSWHPPLIGQPILGLSSVPAAHDAGPLLYWMLALPVHLDPTRGALWGAALLCAAAVALAVVAAWSVRGWLAALGLLVVLAAVTLERPDILFDPVWNPNVGLVLFLATAAVAWAVAAGRLAFWPAQVLIASAATQCHLMFAGGAVLSVVVAPLVGIARTRSLSRWLYLGLAVGAACWLAPLLQQMTGRRGNFSALLALRTSGHPLGWSSGLGALAGVVVPRPAWIHGSGLGKILALLASVGPIWSVVGALIIAVLGIAGSLFWYTDRRDQAALCAVLAVFALAEVYTLASYSPDTVGRFIALGYIVPVMWPIGFSVLLGAAWGLWGVVDLCRRRWLSTDGHPRLNLLVRSRLVPVLPLVAAAAVAALPTALGARDATASSEAMPQWNGFARVRAVTSGVERAVPRGSVRLLPVPSSDVLDEYNVLLGVLWGLYSDGYRPTTNPFYSAFVGSTVSEPPTGTTRSVTVYVSAESADPVVFSSTLVPHEGVGPLGSTE